jgi:hypothetical protein
VNAQRTVGGIAEGSSLGIHQLTRTPIDGIFKLVSAGLARPHVFERGNRENAQTTRVRLEPHHTARTGSLMHFSLAPPISPTVSLARHPNQ